MSAVLRRSFGSNFETEWEETPFYSSGNTTRVLYSCNQIPLVCLSYCYFTLRLLYIIDNNEDDCTSVLQSTKTHISSLSIPTITTSDTSDILTLSYVEIILFFYHLSSITHKTSPSSLHIIIPKSRHATSSCLDLP